MGALDNIKKAVEKKNFDNDVLSLLDNLKRYNMEDQKIQIGTSSLEGSMIEFLLATIDELDQNNQRAIFREAELTDRIMKLYDLLAPPEVEVDTAKTEEPMQITIDGAEVPHAEVVAKTEKPSKVKAIK